MLITPSGNHAQNIKLRLNLHLKKKKVDFKPSHFKQKLEISKSEKLKGKVQRRVLELGCPLMYLGGRKISEQPTQALL